MSDFNSFNFNVKLRISIFLHLQLIKNVLLVTSVFYAFTGASACIQLKKFDEASAWCDKGLAVSFTALNLFVWLVFLGGSPK